MTGKRQTGIDMIRTMLRETTNPNGLDQHGSRLKRNLLTRSHVGTIDKMTDSHHVLTLMKLSVIRPVGAPSPSKEAESRRMIISARAYVGR